MIIFFTEIEFYGKQIDQFSKNKNKTLIMNNKTIKYHIKRKDNHNYHKLDIAIQEK